MKPFFLLFFALGCVPKKKYDALQAELDSTRSDLQGKVDERDAKVTTLEEALKGAQDESEALKAQIADLDSVRAAQLEELNGLRSDKANLLKDRTRLKASVAEMETALRELAERKAAADKRVAEYRDLLGRFKSLIDAGRLKVTIRDGRMVVELATDILFASGKADLSGDGKAALTEVAGVLASIPDRRYQVEGHTDNVPIATEKYASNWELASARAIRVVKTLLEGGLSPDRLSAASFAEYHPATSNDTKEGRTANRRIEIVVAPDLSQLPGFEELNAIADE